MLPPRMWPRLWLAVAGLANAACGGGAFVCVSEEDCRDGAAQGVCQAGGQCSFPDDACGSGQRYGDHGATSPGECVPIATSTSDDTSASEVSLEATGASTTTSTTDATTSTTSGVGTTSDATTLLTDAATTDQPQPDVGGPSNRPYEPCSAVCEGTCITHASGGYDLCGPTCGPNGMCPHVQIGSDAFMTSCGTDYGSSIEVCGIVCEGDLDCPNATFCVPTFGDVGLCLWPID